MKTTSIPFSVTLALMLLGSTFSYAQTISANDAAFVSSMENIAYIITKSHSGHNYTDAEYSIESQPQNAKGKYYSKLKISWKDTRSGLTHTVAGTAHFDGNHCNRQFKVSSTSAKINKDKVPSKLGCLSDHNSNEGMGPGRAFRRRTRNY